VCIGWASEGHEVGEVRHLVRDHKQWNAVGSCWPCSITDVYHGHEGVTPKLVKEVGGYQIDASLIPRTEFSTTFLSVLVVSESRALFVPR